MAIEAAASGPKELGQFGATAAITASELVTRAPSATRDANLFDSVVAGYESNSTKLTAILRAGYELPQELESFANLAIVERHAGLFKLALSFGSWPAWFVDSCNVCQEFVDLKIAADEFSYTPANLNSGQYPYFEVLGPGGKKMGFAVPNGEHEDYLESLDSPEPIDLVRVCATEVVNFPPDQTADWLQAFEVELAEVSSDFVGELSYDCPNCHTLSNYWFDPLDWIARHTAGCLKEVHRLAQAYGWTEDNILAMSDARRRVYLDLLAGAS